MLRKIYLPLLMAAAIIFSASALSAAPISVSAKDYGAKGDGITDDTAAIQKALDAVTKTQGIVYLPAGSYKISNSLFVPERVTLMGEGERWENAMTKLIILEPGFPAVRLSHCSGVKALKISYPNNRDNQNPKPYPPAIQLEGINPCVESIVFDCAWIGVSTKPGGCNSGQGMFRDLTGFVHHVGIHLSGCRDVNRIQDVHWFVGGNGDISTSYFDKNRVGFEFGDVDGIMMDRCFMIRGKAFLHQLHDKDTPDNKPAVAHSLAYHIDECWMEDVKYGFIFEGLTGFVLTNTDILVKNGGTGVIVEPDGLFYNGVISAVQVRSYGGPIVDIEYGSKKPHAWTRLSIADCQLLGGAPAIHLKEGACRANIHDCHLRAESDQPTIIIDPGVDYINISNNIIYTRTEAIQDQSGKEAHKQISGNMVEDKK
ncbi:MAG: glycosyl hydrolase family 28-related protein [Armatimonadota bacterium]